MTDLPKIYDVNIDALREINARDIEQYKDLMFMVGMERHAHQALARLSVLVIRGVISTDDVARAVRPIVDLSRMGTLISGFNPGELDAIIAAHNAANGEQETA